MEISLKYFEFDNVTFRGSENNYSEDDYLFNYTMEIKDHVQSKEGEEGGMLVELSFEEGK